MGLVHGSTAPSSSESVLSGMTRSMSKSMVLPKPWQRGQAPNGELKLNRIGSGSANSMPQVLHWNFSLKRRRSAGRRRSRKSLRPLRDSRSRRCRPGAGAGPGAMARRSTSTKTGFEKSISSSDSGVENSKSRPSWNSRLKPFLRRSNRWSRRACASACGPGTGNSAYQREPSGSGEHARGHFIHRVALRTRVPQLGQKVRPDAREQQAQEIVAFGGSGHRRARIPAGILLPDGDRRRDAVDLVDLRLLHALQELARVSRERFDVAPLALGVDGVEGQRRFAGAGDARDHGQLVMGNRQRNVLEVVDARAANPDVVLHGSCCEIPV